MYVRRVKPVPPRLLRRQVVILAQNSERIRRLPDENTSRTMWLGYLQAAAVKLWSAPTTTESFARAAQTEDLGTGKPSGASGFLHLKASPSRRPDGVAKLIIFVQRQLAFSHKG